MNTLAAEIRRRVERVPSRPAVAAAFLAGVLVLAAKAPDALRTPQFWAEDGVVFFVPQHASSVPLLFEPHAGYLHFLPRLTAWAASGFSAVHAPLIYNLAALLFGAAALASLRQLDRLGLGFALALAPVLLAPTNGEVWGTITNVQWLMQFYLVSMLARLFQGGGEDFAPVPRAAAAFAVGLTGPFSIFAVLSASVGLLWLRWRAGPLQRVRSAGVSLEWTVLGLCAALQALLIVTTANTDTPPVAFSLDVALGLVKSVQVHVFGAQWMPVLLFPIALLALLAFVLRRSTAPQQAIVVATALFSVSQMVAVAHSRTDQFQQVASFGFGDRYYFLFKMAFWWLVAVAMVRAAPPRSHLPAIVLFVALGCNALAMPNAFQRQPLRDLHWADYARRIDAGEALDVPINPVSWQIHVPAEH